MKNQFKKIGIVGGAGPKAAALLCERLIRICQMQLGAIEDQDFPEFVLVSYPFSPMCAPDEAEQNSERLGYELARCFELLQDAGSEVVGIACNTLHNFIDEPERFGFSFVHIGKAVLRTAQAQGLRRLLFFGTSTSIHQGLYRSAACEIIYPASKVQDNVDRTIREVLKGNESEKLANEFRQLASGCVDSNWCDGLVLGCTELSVLYLNHLQTNWNYPVIDSTQELAQALINVSLDRSL